MFKMFKKQNTDAQNEQSFEKNIKTLWVYTTLFCAFALVLIIVSSIIQGKINSTAEYYQELYEGEKTSSQSTISNIKTENDSLKAALSQYKKENELLMAQKQSDDATLEAATELVENGEYLLCAQREAYTGSYKKARNYLALVNKDVLTEQMSAIYSRIAKMVGYE